MRADWFGSARKNWLGWLAAFAIVAVFSLFPEQLDVSVGTWILFGGLALYVQYQRSWLDEDKALTELPTYQDLWALADAEPIDPLHEQTEGLPDEGWGITPGVHLFFGHFGQFGDLLNMSSSPWRIQEVARTEVGTLGDDSPVRGRRYKVFYGARDVGQLSLSCDLEYTLAKPNVYAVIEIRRARSLPASTIVDFCSRVAHNLSSGSKGEYDEAQRLVRNEMLSALWQLAPELVENPDIEVRWSGAARWYLERAGILSSEDGEKS